MIELIAFVRPTEKLPSDHGVGVMGSIVSNLAERLSVNCLISDSSLLYANGAVEKWNRKLARDITSFVSTETVDENQHGELACFRYDKKIL